MRGRTARNFSRRGGCLSRLRAQAARLNDRQRHNHSLWREIPASLPRRSKPGRSPLRWQGWHRGPRQTRLRQAQVSDLAWQSVRGSRRQNANLDLMSIAEQRVARPVVWWPSKEQNLKLKPLSISIYWHAPVAQANNNTNAATNLSLS